jgi:hypothetical protein
MACEAFWLDLLGYGTDGSFLIFLTHGTVYCCASRLSLGNARYSYAWSSSVRLSEQIRATCQFPIAVMEGHGGAVLTKPIFVPTLVYLPVNCF